jgi:hypothetical protein
MLKMPPVASKIRPGSFAKSLQINTGDLLCELELDRSEVASENFKKEDVTKAAVRQPKAECDPESDLPCSSGCPFPRGSVDLIRRK